MRMERNGFYPTLVGLLFSFLSDWVLESSITGFTHSSLPSLPSSPFFLVFPLTKKEVEKEEMEGRK